MSAPAPPTVLLPRLPRRRVLGLALALAGGAAGPPRAARAQEDEEVGEAGAALLAEDDLLQRARGAQDAPNRLVEYASMTCPHCATFHREILPRLDEDWIATGRLRYVYRHFPLDATAVRAALLAECAEADEGFFTLLELLYGAQEEWATTSDPESALLERAVLVGLDEEAARACMDDADKVARMGEEYERAIRDLNVRSTPTLFFNGARVRNRAEADAFLEEISGLALD